MSRSKSNQKLSERYSSGKSDVRNSGSFVGRIFSKPIVFVGIVVVVFGLGIAVTTLSGENGREADATEAYNLVVAPENTEETVQDENPQKVAPGTYDVCMNSTWSFADARTASDNAYVENLQSNYNAVCFVVSRDDTDTVIYESPIIPVGSHLEGITLSDTTLSKGTYPCTLRYSLLDDNNQEISSVSVAISVKILND